MNQQKWDERFLGLAGYISCWSKDPSTQVGAVIVDEKHRVMGVGYNGFPVGINDSDERLLDRDIKLSKTIHAEINCIHFSQKTEGCTLYTYPFMPCNRCSPQIIQVGLKRVVSIYSENPRWKKSFIESTENFLEVGIDLFLFKGQDFLKNEECLLELLKN